MADFDARWARVSAESAVWAHDLEVWQASTPAEDAGDDEWEAWHGRGRDLWARWEALFDSGEQEG
jgi:hypothetical protein